MSHDTRHTSTQRPEENVGHSLGGAMEAKQALMSTPPVDTHLLRSNRIRQTFKIQVVRPAGIPGQSRKLPVVYATDGNMNFDMLKNMLHLLTSSAADAPPFMLVSIGYPGDSPSVARLLRCREFSFPPYPKFDVKAVPRMYEEELLPEEGAKDFNGAEDFRQFIKEDLIPFIDEKYETIPGDRTYFGHSGGAFFGLFTLLTDSSLFRNYICASPGLLMHGPAPGGFHYDNYDCGALMVRDFIASGRSLDGIKLHLSAGADEEFEAGLGSWKMVTGFHAMVKLLKQAAIPGLQVMSELFPGETHSTVYPIAFTHGVQAMLGTRRVTRSVYF